MVRKTPCRRCSYELDRAIIERLEGASEERGRVVQWLLWLFVGALLGDKIEVDPNFENWNYVGTKKTIIDNFHSILAAACSVGGHVCKRPSFHGISCVNWRTGSSIMRFSKEIAAT
jgi:hypothetical protein